MDRGDKIDAMYYPRLRRSGEDLEKTLSILKQAARFFADQQASVYLVGGSLRNLLSGYPCGDWDLVTDGEAHKLARRLADTVGGFYSYMHEKASRVVVRFPAAEDLVLDIAPLHGQTLEEDLRARDFTLNALAAPLAPVLEQMERAGSLVDAEVFRRDPLRMLRALRLARRYGLTITAETEKLIRRDAHLLPQAAAERIQAELWTLLAQPGALEQLYRLDTCGLLMVLFPELQAACGMRQPAPHHWDVLEHSLQCVAALEGLTAALEAAPTTPFAPELAALPADGEALAEIRELLREGEQQEVFRFSDLHSARMKLAALLHDIGKPLTYTVDGQGNIHFYGHPQIGAPIAGEIMGRFSASTQDRRLVQLVTAHHMRPGQLGQDGQVTPRAIRRYFVDLGPTGILVALFSLADHLATLGPQPRTAAWSRHLVVTRLLLTSYIRERAKIMPPRLVRADELLSRLRLQPGPIVGQLLEAIAEAQADGLIHSREEAILLAREYVEARVQ